GSGGRGSYHPIIAVRAWPPVSPVASLGESGETMVQGLVPTMLVGMLGALIAELIRLVPALRAGRPPQRLEYLASVIMVVLGAGAALLGWDTPQPAYKVAVLGAAFPLLFTASVSALT